MRNINCGKIIHRPQLLLVGSSPAQGQTSYLGPALLNCMEHVPVHTLDLSKLYGITGCSPEEACVQVCYICLDYFLKLVIISMNTNISPNSTVVHNILINNSNYTGKTCIFGKKSKSSS